MIKVDVEHFQSRAPQSISRSDMIVATPILIQRYDLSHCIIALVSLDATGAAVCHIYVMHGNVL